MKTIHFLICIIFAFDSVFAQAPKDLIPIEDPNFGMYYQEQFRPARLQGQILNLSKEERDSLKIFCHIKLPHVDLMQLQVLSVDSLGRFVLDIDQTFPYQMVALEFKRLFYTTIYLKEGLFIELDAEKLRDGEHMHFADGVTYVGTDGEMNTFLNRHQMYRRDTRREIYGQLLTYTRDNLPFIQYRSSFDSLWNLLKIIDEEYIHQNPSPYAWIIHNERMSDYYGRICIAHWYHTDMDSSLWNQVTQHTNYTISQNLLFYRYLTNYIGAQVRWRFRHFQWKSLRAYSKIDTQGIELVDTLSVMQSAIQLGKPVDSTTYKNFENRAWGYFDDTVAQIYLLQTMAKIDSLFPPGKADYMKLWLNWRGKSKSTLVSETVLAHMKTEWCVDVIMERYHQSLEKDYEINTLLTNAEPLAADLPLGEPIELLPFGAQLYQVKAGSASKLLASIKKSFSNDALLMDFWATWCGPCVREMPASKQLQDETQDLPLTYLYICTSKGSTLNTWKRMIARYEIPGIHLYVEESVMEELMALFSFSAYPSYAFINRNGKYLPGSISRISHTSRKYMISLLE